ncbi:MAG: hypothetical protein ACTHOA_07875 [Rhodanobacter sp.]
MSSVLYSPLKVDVSKISPEILQGLETGKYVLSSSNGVVYKATGGVVKHLPLVPIDPQELASAEQLLRSGSAMSGANMAAVSATAIGAAVVVVAVVVATTYLADKIEQVKRAVGEVAQTVDQQDEREYLDHMSDYAGVVRSARELLQPNLPRSEVQRQAENRIERLAEARHQLLDYVQKLPQLVSSSGKSSAAQQDRALRFMIGVLDLMPFAIAVERELCLAADKPVLAVTRCSMAGSEFRRGLAGFWQWCEEQFRLLAGGKGGFADVLAAHRGTLNALFNSQVHDLLLGDFDSAFAGRTTQPKADPDVVDPDGVAFSGVDSNGQSRS